MFCARQNDPIQHHNWTSSSTTSRYVLISRNKLWISALWGTSQVRTQAKVHLFCRSSSGAASTRSAAQRQDLQAALLFFCRCCCLIQTPTEWQLLLSLLSKKLANSSSCRWWGRRQFWKCLYKGKSLICYSWQARILKLSLACFSCRVICQNVTLGGQLEGAFGNKSR